jgi:hypothetical protein
VVFAALFLGVVVWFSSIKPSHDRPWRPEVAVMPRAFIDDERDLVRVRTNYRKEDVFLYRIQTSPEFARRLFLVYLERINELADQPEFYHLLSNNCTINIVRYANLAGRVGRFDIRHLLPGLADRYLYSVGALDTTLPFEELRRRSQINEAAQGAGNAEDFSERIRKSLPTPPR